jgi:hypothetical protein
LEDLYLAETPRCQPDKGEIEIQAKAGTPQKRQLLKDWGGRTM